MKMAASYFTIFLECSIFLVASGTPFRDCSVDWPERPLKTDLSAISLEGCDTESEDPCEFNTNNLRRWMQWNITFDHDEMFFLQHVGTSLKEEGHYLYDDEQHFVGADIYHVKLDERDITKLIGKEYAKMIIRKNELLSYDIVLVNDIKVPEGTSGRFQVRMAFRNYGQGFCVENDYVAKNV